MNMYTWEGLNQMTGRRCKGRMAAVSETIVRNKLTEDGVTVVSVRLLPSFMGSLVGGGTVRRKAKGAERAVLYRNLAMAAATQKPIQFALDSAQLGLKKSSRLHPAIKRIRKYIDDGDEPHVALGREAKVIGEEASAVYEAAMQTANPEIALEALSDITEQASEIASKVKGSMIQPVIYILLAVAAMFLMMMFVIPDLASMFEELGAEMPAATVQMISIAELMQNNALVVLGATVALAIGGYFLYRREDVKLTISQISHKIPIVGPIMCSMAAQRICSLMGVMLSADVAHRVALRIVSDSMKAPAIKHSLDKVSEDMHNTTLPVAIERHLSTYDRALAALAEQTVSGLDDPGSNWTRYGKFKHRETERNVTGLTNALQPLLFTFIAVFIGVMALIFYLPMFDVFTVIADSAGI